MSGSLGIRPVRRYSSPLGPTVCPYDNRLPPARWFFYLRLRRALRLADLAADASVLDLGCWEGHFLPSLAGCCRRVVGLDDDSASLIERLPGRRTILELARALAVEEHAAVDRLDLVKADGCSLPFRRASFDAVFCLDTLPYVPEARRGSLLDEVARVLRPRATAVFTLPVEIGPALLVREVLRRVSGTWLDGYTLRELVAAVRHSPRARDATRPTNLAGYDYRRDRAAIAARFTVDRATTLPCNALSFLAPTVLLRGRPVASEYQAGASSP